MALICILAAMFAGLFRYDGGTYECTGCGKILDLSEVIVAYKVRGCDKCGNTVRQISNLPKAYWEADSR
ncbi:MAG: hypothetical protein NTY30_01270 [Candidatus Berkelbacteria bacterium]|nr:hypothetical protein [Candidatus Berkelbacteria bacterium]